MYDVLIIGGGPAGVTAAVYAGRKELKTLMLTESIGGQSMTSSTVENWIGDISLTGVELAQKLEAHVKAKDTVEVKKFNLVEKIEKIEGGFRATTKKGNTFDAITIILCAGGRHRHLNVPGEEEYNGKGVAYCSTCDAPFFRDTDVAVVGGGNSGLEAVVDLLPFAKTIKLMARDDKLVGDPITQKDVVGQEKVEIIYNANTMEILGEEKVTGLKYKDLKTDEEKIVDVGGVFVEIGAVPNSELAKDFLELNDYGQVKVDHQTFATSVKGVFAAGEVTDVMYSQNNIAAGDAVKATLSAYSYVLDQKRQ